MQQSEKINFKKFQATKSVCNRIAIVFDFDDTLASDTLAYRDVSESELHVPLFQLISVGDGASDVPYFSALCSSPTKGWEINQGITISGRGSKMMG